MIKRYKVSDAWYDASWTLLAYTVSRWHGLEAANNVGLDYIQCITGEEFNVGFFAKGLKATFHVVEIEDDDGGEDTTAETKSAALSKGSRKEPRVPRRRDRGAASDTPVTPTDDMGRTGQSELGGSIDLDQITSGDVLRQPDLPNVGDANDDTGK
jgi:hypothetical protein